MSKSESAKKVEETLREGLLKTFLGEKVNKNTEDQVKNTVRNMLAKMSAVLHTGTPYEDLKVNVLWNVFSLKEKALWFYYNRLTKIGAKERAKIDQINEQSYKEYLEELETCEEWESWEIDWHRLEYPDLYQPEPKQMIRVDVKIKPIQPIEFIGINLQLEDIEKHSSK